MEKVKTAISSIFESQEYLLDTPRNTITRKAAKDLLDAVAVREKVFSEFASALLSRISCFLQNGAKGVQKKRFCQTFISRGLVTWTSCGMFYTSVLEENWWWWKTEC